MMGQLINIGMGLDPFYVDVDHISSLSPTKQTYRDEDGYLKKILLYTIKLINGTSYTTCKPIGEQIIKAKGLIKDG